ncbi:MAG: HK97 gp10 family phage protein [Clostridium sp.]|uniref:HK97 gp10 family phage protein n=1 Tax=Clostridium sp. TaxID=1506 RepID=UPI0025C396F9|nr:HK97 gp10 family phage protein [Clostridium sp.]MBS4958413.1 HK97 gp10 family phage protein [Clostridium sp.]
MNSNRKYNEAAVRQFRKELLSMFDDIEEIDKRVLNTSVNKGVAIAKKNTNVVTGFMRRSWRSAPAVKSKTGEVTKSLVNSADYSEYVNYGHRIVNKLGETVGWVKGQFILEKAVGFIERQLVKEFKNEVERINKKYDK